MPHDHERPLLGRCARELGARVSKPQGIPQQKYDVCAREGMRLVDLEHVVAAGSNEGGDVVLAERCRLVQASLVDEDPKRAWIG